MSKVLVEEISLSCHDVNKLPYIFKNTLSECKDTQVYIEEKLYNEIIRKIKKFCIWTEEVYSGFLYNDGIEKAFLFYSNNAKSKIISQMNFVSNCKDFKQLTYFASDGIRYTHFLSGINKILIIYAT